MNSEIQDINLITSNYKNHRITDLTNCLRKASTQKEKDFFFDLLGVSPTFPTKPTLRHKMDNF